MTEEASIRDMPLDSINLRKLLQLFFLGRGALVSALRADIRETIAREEGRSGSGGGDFYVPFWTDAKAHVADRGDLSALVRNRISAHRGRARLYPLLERGFLLWWEERRRWNEPFQFYEQGVKARYVLPGTSAEVKVENLLALRVGESSRLYYPYFFEEPAVSEEAARMGFWLLGRALPANDPNDFRILDVLRGRSFAPGDAPARGDEERVFLRRYSALHAEWERLRSGYPRG